LKEIRNSLRKKSGSNIRERMTKELTASVILAAGNNNNVLSPWVYVGRNDLQNNIVGSCGYVGIYAISQQPFAGDSWELHENEDLTLNTVYDLGGTGGGDNFELETVTFPGANYVTFEGNGFLVFKDYTTTFMIRSISENQMEVTVFLHMFLNGDQTVGIDQPSGFVNLTLVHPEK